MQWMHYFSLCVIFTDWAISANVSEVETLYSDLLSGYNKYVRPLTSTNEPIYVNVSFSLMGIKEFDEVNGKFSIIGYFMITWRDSRLAWSPFVYSNIYSIELPESKVWVPNLTIINSYDSVKGFGTGVSYITYTPTGTAYWPPVDVISSICDVDVTYYPFDTQSCSMEVLCWGFTSSAIILHAEETKVNTDNFSEHGTWELLDQTMMSFEHPVSYARIDIKMKRRPTFAVINIVLPMLFIMVLNLLVFIIPVESGERVSYSITVLLAIAVFLTLVGDNLPKTSKPTAILSYFLLTDLVLSSLICFFVIFGLSFHFKDAIENPVPKKITSVVKFCCRRRKCVVHRKSTITVEPEKEMSTDKKVPLPDDSEDDEEVTWKMVSNCFDWLVLVMCLLVIIVLTILYIVMTI
jgi:hypothetical protein